MNWLLIIQLVEQLFPVVLKAVQTVEEATGKPTDQATKEVIDHLTPGAPTSATLSAQNPT